MKRRFFLLIFFFAGLVAVGVAGAVAHQLAGRGPAAAHGLVDGARPRRLLRHAAGVGRVQRRRHRSLVPLGLLARSVKFLFVEQKKDGLVSFELSLTKHQLTHFLLWINKEGTG